MEGGGEHVAVEVRDIPEGVAAMLHLASIRLAERGIAPAGPPTALFRSGDGNGTHLVEAGFPVSPGVEGDELLRVTSYPAASAATTEHVGSYDGLHVTAQRVIATVRGPGLRVAQPIRIESVQTDVHARLVWPLAAP